MPALSKLHAREILDSRGNPTIEVDAYAGKQWARAAVPSGASTGKHEALELRDGDARYGGKGVQKAVMHVNLLLNKKLKGASLNQQKLDAAMLALDGTVSKSNLGANAMLGVSLAAARLSAQLAHKPLYANLTTLTKRKLALPVPFANIINGGKHAGSNLQFQEFMLAPTKLRTFAEATQAVSEIYHALKKLLEQQYGKSATNVGDEGGFAPPLDNAQDALELLEQAITETGYAGKVFLAMDVAASEFYRDACYHIPQRMESGELVDFYVDLIRAYPIVSLEDPFEQDDFTPWRELTAKAKIQIVGDDLLVTNPLRIQMATERDLCNALLLKVNQIGTLSEAIHAAQLAFKQEWNVMVSHRSGETADSFIADLAVALGCGQIKLGAPARSERVEKYNQLLRIEEELGKNAKYARWS